MGLTRILQCVAIAFLALGCGSDGDEHKVFCLDGSSCYETNESNCTTATVVSSCDALQNFIECKSSYNGCECRPILAVSAPIAYACNGGVSGGVCCATSGYPNETWASCRCTDAVECTSGTQVSSCSN